MRNTVPLYFSVAGDGAGGVIGWTWSYTFDEGQTYLNTTGMGGAGQSGPTLYYVLLNKFTIGSHVSYATNYVGPSYVADGSLFTTDKSVADDFGVDSAPVTGWQFDVSDDRWVKNVDLAKEEVAIRGKTKVGTFQTTLLQALYLTVNTLMSSQNPYEFSVGQQVLNIANNLASGKITADEATSQYQKIVDANHKLFYG